MPRGSEEHSIILGSIGMYIRVGEDRKLDSLIRFDRNDVRHLDISSGADSQLTVVLRYTPAFDSSSISLKIRQFPPLME